MQTNNYFIRADYIDNPVLSFDSDCTTYWTDERVRTSALFQYHSYEYARDVFRRNGLKSVIDVGAGPGTKLGLFFKGLAQDIVGVDQPGTESIFNKVLPEGEFYATNLEDPCFSVGRKFDMVICSDVIEHLGDPDALLEILKSHLSANGLAIISTPDRELRWGPSVIQSPNKQHVREWNAQEFRNYLADRGFFVLEHRHFPLKRLNGITFALSRIPILHKKVMRSKWYPNQVILARLK